MLMTKKEDPVDEKTSGPLNIQQHMICIDIEMTRLSLIQVTPNDPKSYPMPFWKVRSL